METRLGPRVLATLICFIKPMAACCLNQTRQCHRRVIDVRLIGPSERADARTTRKCQWECVGKVESQLKRRKYAAMVVEPRVQGAAGMVMHPEGWLKRVSQAVRASGALLIADEVMTAFGRTGEVLPDEKKRWCRIFCVWPKG